MSTKDGVIQTSGAQPQRNGSSPAPLTNAPRVTSPWTIWHMKGTVQNVELSHCFDHMEDVRSIVTCTRGIWWTSNDFIPNEFHDCKLASPGSHLSKQVLGPMGYVVRVTPSWSESEPKQSVEQSIEWSETLNLPKHNIPIGSIIHELHLRGLKLITFMQVHLGIITIHNISTT